MGVVLSDDRRRSSCESKDSRRGVEAKIFGATRALRN